MNNDQPYSELQFWLMNRIYYLEEQYDYITTSAKYLIFDDLESLNDGILSEASSYTKETLCRE